jgi:hypothetical protein
MRPIKTNCRVQIQEELTNTTKVFEVNTIMLRVLKRIPKIR